MFQDFDCHYLKLPFQQRGSADDQQIFQGKDGEQEVEERRKGEEEVQEGA